MKQDIFNLCLWLTTVLMIIIIISIIINKINNLSKQITKNNLTYNCNNNTLPQLYGNNSLPEHFEPYDGSYTNGFSVNNVLCSDLDVSKSLNTTANINFYNTTEENPNKTDKNKTITISKDGNISGVNKLINDNITFSNNATITKDLTVNNSLSSKTISNSDKISSKSLSCSEAINSKDLTLTNTFKISNKDNIKINDKKLFDLIYPIGAIYQSTSSISPATLFGGTWEQIKDRFLYNASSDSTKTGGSSTATLSIENIPPHTHSYNVGGSSSAGRSGKTYSMMNMWIGYGQTTGSTGGKNGKTQSFSIMPPYYKVYCWRRTA